MIKKILKNKIFYALILLMSNIATSNQENSIIDLKGKLNKAKKTIFIIENLKENIDWKNDIYIQGGLVVSKESLLKNNYYLHITKNVNGVESLEGKFFLEKISNINNCDIYNGFGYTIIECNKNKKTSDKDLDNELMKVYKG